MGARTAIKALVTSDVLEFISRFLGVDYQFDFCVQRCGLSHAMEQAVQGITYSFARRSVEMYDEDPHWSLTFPHLDAQPLADFGAWVQAGCPVYVDGVLHHRPLALPAASSTDRVWRIDSL